MPANSETPKAAPHTVVTGHANADFDCFASIIAAGKLYPDAVLIFPGSQEKSLRNFYIESAYYLFDFKAAKDVDLNAVKRLVVVDTRQRSRIGHVAAVLDNPGLEIHTYDHHPDSDDDLDAKVSVWEPWGSCAAILTREIRERGLALHPEEATAIGLGLYEDTGSFTFSSTTEHDLTAAAWLLPHGMDLSVITDLITRELTAQQVSILNTLIESATRTEIGGREVVVAEASMEHYVGDFAMLAHKLIDMENARILFAMGRMDDRIQLVARSRDDTLDVGRICEHFGGGGHPFAASASIKDRTPAQVKDEIFSLVLAQVNPQLTAGKLMSRPAKVIDKDRTLAEAAEVMGRHGLKAMPVVEPGGMVLAGIIEHDIADRAVGHELGDVEVREYMQRNITAASPDQDFATVMDLIVGPRQRLVPVVEDGAVTGVLTRTDLINVLIEEPARIPEALHPDKRRRRNIGSLMRERLPEKFRTIVEMAGQLGEEQGCEVFAVGGFVRDVLLNRPNQDLDLVVEGDGVAFAGALAERLGGRVKSHSKFRTAVIILDDGQRLDVATARLEYYEYPAALPVVELSSIKMDLYRRDFTINALAVHLNPPRFGQLEDFFGAQRDIKERLIRVLHSLSFVEDPTRIVRAIRFEQRFDFRIGGQTERLIKNAVRMAFFQKLSGSRIFHELQLLLDESEALKCLQRMEEFGLLELIHPLLVLKQHNPRFLEELQSVRNWYRLLYEEPAVESWKLFFLGLCNSAPPEEMRDLARGLNFSPKQERDFQALRDASGRALGQVISWSKQNGPLSDLVAILDELPVEGVLLLMAKSRRDEMRRAISMYLTRLRHLELDVSGDDLKALGLEAGPRMGEMLRALHAAKIDGRAECRDDQLKLAEELIHVLPQASKSGSETRD